MANDYDGHANQLKDLARVPLRFKDPRNLVAAHIRCAAASTSSSSRTSTSLISTPMGYSDLNLVVAVRVAGDAVPVRDAAQPRCDARRRSAPPRQSTTSGSATRLPELCRGRRVDADKLESFISGRLNNQRSTARSRRSRCAPTGCSCTRTCSRALSEREGGEIDFGSASTPPGLGEVYATNFLRPAPDGADDDHLTHAHRSSSSSPPRPSR